MEWKNGIRRWMIGRTYVNEVMEGKNTPLGWWFIQDKCKMPPLESFPNSQDKTSRRRTSLTQISLNLSRVTFLQFPYLNLHEHSTSIYSVRELKFRWENSNETHLKLPPKNKSHGRCDFTWEVWLGFFLWHLLKLHLHLLFMSHGRCDLFLYISTPYISIYTFLLCSTKKLLYFCLFFIIWTLYVSPLFYNIFLIILRRLIGRTSSALALVHSSLWWSLSLLVEMTL